MNTAIDKSRLFELLPDEIDAHVYASLASTNLTLRSLAEQGAPAHTLVISASQTSGRGRLGRGFFSPDGAGVYFSLLLRPEPCDNTAALVTAAAALAAAEACEAVFGVHASIKWVNDVLVGGKKIAGILAESFSTNGFFVILGIGANISPPPGGFPEELAKAGSILPSDPPELARERFAAETVRRFLLHTGSGELSAFSDLYRSRCDMAGRRISVTRGNESFIATALGVNDDLSLAILHDDGYTESINYGEVTLHEKH